MIAATMIEALSSPGFGWAVWVGLGWLSSFFSQLQVDVDNAIGVQ